LSIDSRVHVIKIQGETAVAPYPIAFDREIPKRRMIHAGVNGGDLI
jgi:hypothetical protein